MGTPGRLRGGRLHRDCEIVKLNEAHCSHATAMAFIMVGSFAGGGTRSVSKSSSVTKKLRPWPSQIIQRNGTFSRCH
jgi:hypothetical protein